MDYEKKYKEALEWMREIYHSLTGADKEDAEHYFPELAESEDERIRKALVKEFTVKVEKGFEWKDGIPNNAVLAWLEKQKDAIGAARQRGYEEGMEDGVSMVEKWQKEQKPKMTPKWLYRLEFKDSSCGLWYDGYGKWCFESGIGSIGGCKTKTLPMDYDARYKQDGRDWFSSCSQKEDLMHWYSLEDVKELISKGFVFTRYLATEYHEYEQQTVFIKETALYREEIDIFELFGQKPVEWSEEDEIWARFILRELEQDKKDSPEYSKHFARLIDWFTHRFKSLRPQPHWKPSEEQTEALKRVYYNRPIGSAELNSLESLYNDLKKL